MREVFAPSLVRVGRGTEVWRRCKYPKRPKQCAPDTLPPPKVVAAAGSQRSAMGWEGAVAKTWQSRALGNGAQRRGRNGPQAEAVAVASVPQ